MTSPNWGDAEKAVIREQPSIIGRLKKYENLLYDTLKKGEKAERKETSSKSEKEGGEQENNSDNHQQNCNNRHKEPDSLKRNNTDKLMVG